MDPEHLFIEHFSMRFEHIAHQEVKAHIRRPYEHVGALSERRLFLFECDGAGRVVYVYRHYEIFLKSGVVVIDSRLICG